MPILRIRDVVKLTKLSKSTIYQLIKEGSFPANYKIAKQATGWDESEVKEWMTNLKPNAEAIVREHPEATDMSRDMSQPLGHEMPVTTTVIGPSSPDQSTEDGSAFRSAAERRSARDAIFKLHGYKPTTAYVPEGETATTTKSKDAERKYKQRELEKEIGIIPQSMKVHEEDKGIFIQLQKLMDSGLRYKEAAASLNRNPAVRSQFWGVLAGLIAFPLAYTIGSLLGVPVMMAILG